MNIIEAAEAAIVGKRVALKESEVRWVNDWLEWKATGSVVLISKNVLSNNWRITPIRRNCTRSPKRSRG